MSDTLHRRIPHDVFAPLPLPGVRPLPSKDWLIFDEAFAGQMAERDRLLAERRQDVIAMQESARPAAEELLDMVLSKAYPGAADHVDRSDGVTVPILRDDPMGTLARLVQCDLVLMQKPEGQREHVLTAAALLFPASWTLAQKFGRPLLRIHDPVDSYDEAVAKRVQRLFDGVQVNKPLWRFNALWYADAVLHQPRPEGVERPQPAAGAPRFMRSERQVILRLPRTSAVLFGIHTYLMREDDLRAG